MQQIDQDAGLELQSLHLRAHDGKPSCCNNAG
jgi:hypothetical protein